MPAKKHPAGDTGLQVEQPGLHLDQPGLELAPDGGTYAPEAIRTENEKYFVSKSAIKEGHLPYPPSSRSIRRCGLRQQTCYILCGSIVLLVVVLAGVVGGVLGTRGGGGQDTTPSNGTPVGAVASGIPVTVPKGSGFFVTPDSSGSSALYVYWQDVSGNIIETKYQNDSFVQLRNTTVVPAGNALPNAPFSSIMWTNDTNTLIRALFYVDPQMRLMTTNTTSDSWMNPAYDILTGFNDTVYEDTVGLAACVDTSRGLSGIRIYYVSKSLYLTEAIGHFDNAWRRSRSFSDVDITSGVACTIQGSVLTLYYRNSSSVRIASQTWDFSTDISADYNTTWEAGPQGPEVPGRSDIAACHQSNSDTILWQNTSGVIQLGQSKGTSDITAFRQLDQAWFGSKMSATCVADGSVVLYQSQANQTQIAYEKVSNDASDSMNGGWLVY